LKKLIIVGASKLGLDMIKTLKEQKLDFEGMGYLDDEGPFVDYEKHKLVYLGKLRNWIPGKEDHFLIAIEIIAMRVRLVEYLSGLGAKFFSFVHPTSILGDHVTLGDGVYIGPFCYLGDYSHVGSFSILKSRILIRKYVSLGLFSLLDNQVVIGEGVSLGDGNVLGKGTWLKSVNTTHDQNFYNVSLNSTTDFSKELFNWFRLN
jgi:acetyltransferase-like isoleucine patch superfamily enzyme